MVLFLKYVFSILIVRFFAIEVKIFLKLENLVNLMKEEHFGNNALTLLEGILNITGERNLCRC